MSTTTRDLDTAVKIEVEEIVASGTNIRPRLTEAIKQAACQSEQSGSGLVGLIRATVEGARVGLARAVPADRDDVLRQVVDALGDGLSQTALAAELAVQEAVSNSRQYTEKDLARLRDDLTGVRELFTETVGQGLKTCKALTAGQVATAMSHVERVANRLRPEVARALDAVQKHPVVFAREGLRAGISAGQGAAGSLFQALGRLLQRAGEGMRGEYEQESTE